MADAPRAGREIVAALHAHGVRRVVAAPGSRNTPLLLELAEADTQGRLDLTMRTDERGAGFWALGQAKASGAPVAVVTTSGTAVGNLFPAVMEAHHARVPLVVVSADRPATALDTGANQTTDQHGIFGGFVRASADVSDTPDAARSRRHQIARLLAAAADGPVHLNVRFSTPLVDDDDPVDAASWQRHQPRREPRHVELTDGPRTVVLAGDATPELGARANRLSAGYPLLAEPSSNARHGHALGTARLLLGSALADEIERVVVVGHPTLSRPQQVLVQRDIEIVHVGPGEVAANTTLVADDVTLPAPDPGWTRRWHDADAHLAARLAELLADRWCGPTVARIVHDATIGHDLVVGSSSPVRDLDIAPVQPNGPHVWANRGLAGIDGLIATASGIASVTGSATLHVGDISFAHDLTGLLTGPWERRPNLRIVLVNDGGGSIFHTLEQGAPAHADHFERVFGTPLTVDVESLAAAMGVGYRRAADPDTLQAALQRPRDGVDIVEVPIPRHDRRALEQEIRDLV